MYLTFSKFLPNSSIKNEPPKQPVILIKNDYYLLSMNVLLNSQMTLIKKLDYKKFQNNRLFWLLSQKLNLYFNVLRQ